MSEQNVDLSTLWQKQDVVLPDVQKLKKQWRLMRMKQWLYFGVDTIAACLTFLIYFYVEDELSTLSKLLLIVLLISMVPITIYLIWLRRHALNATQKDTDSFLEALKKQVRNNIRIAKISKHSVWAVPIFHLLFTLIQIQENGWQLTGYEEKLLFVSIFNVIFVPCVWIWAHKREKRFGKELKSLQSL